MIGALSIPFGNLFGILTSKTVFFMGPDSMVFALVAAYLIFFLYNFKVVRESAKRNRNLCCSLVIITLFTILSMISNFSFRFGGFLNGALLGLFLARKIKDPSKTQQDQMPPSGFKKYCTLRNLALITFIVSNTIQLVFLFK